MQVSQKNVKCFTKISVKYPCLFRQMNIQYQNKLIDIAVHGAFTVRAKYPIPCFLRMGAGEISVVFFRHVNELVTIPL